ncbi:cupin domain-containing protein [Catenovulum sp. SM1970]|uniref:ChrR family anti-sigma-E factor n=1 Tax=Marinifaba aquimaris TaxID=2741323 RepID=UPI001573E0D9|nr:ChrR family anti-sigma-E factor [Marinifaba aquimaris]NTS76479.1 cupin domain-containing protein [Marinifaba aquimaris]
MIKHHPKLDLIQAYTQGKLPASLSAAISIHASMCPDCQQLIDEQTELHASSVFENGGVNEVIYETETLSKIFAEADLDAMISAITSDDSVSQSQPVADKQVEINGQTYQLPRALANINHSNFSGIGKISRASLDLGEGDLHSHLLHIDAGGSVPSHTHKGFELTLLLDGTFSDESGEYVKGDFIMLDSSHEHTPISEKGCLCMTIADDALHFTQGLSKLLNPIGKMIY